MADVYHLKLDRDALGGATVAVLPGDPGRVPLIATTIDPGATPLAANREYTTWLARCEGRPVLITSTGIGGPSTAIAVEELAQLGVRTFLRVGTTGSIQPGIELEDVIVTSASVRLDGTSRHYAPIEYPAVAHHEVVAALVRAAKDLGLRHHVGITASSDSFYPGQERYSTFSGYVIRAFRDSLEEWRRLGVLNYEMESAALLTVCAAFGLRAGCVAGVVAQRDGREAVVEASVRRGEVNATAVAARVLPALLTLDK